MILSINIDQLIELDILDKVGDSTILKAKGLIIDQPKDKYVEEIKARFEHMIAYNESRGNQVSRECMIYKKCKEKQFEGIQNMHAFMKSLESGLTGRKQIMKDKEDIQDLIL